MCAFSFAFFGVNERNDVVAVADARSMIESLRKAGGHPQYSEYPNLGHVIGPASFAESGLLPWLFAQKRTVHRKSAFFNRYVLQAPVVLTR